MVNKKRLIDANAIKYPDYFYEDEAHPDPFIEGFRQGKIDAIGEIRALAPTVDAVEVVHGKWEILDDGYGCELMCCTVCKSEFYDGDNDTVDQQHNYCPNCGAKMEWGGGRRMSQMKGINLCADCAYYSMKKHKCTRGATDESDPLASFYGDCPLDDVAPVVRCKDCKHRYNGTDCTHPLLLSYSWGAIRNVKDDDFCSYGERRTDA